MTPYEANQRIEMYLRNRSQQQRNTMPQAHNPKQPLDNPISLLVQAGVNPHKLSVTQLEAFCGQDINVQMKAIQVYLQDMEFEGTQQDNPISLLVQAGIDPHKLSTTQLEAFCGQNIQVQKKSIQVYRQNMRFDGTSQSRNAGLFRLIHVGVFPDFLSQTQLDSYLAKSPLEQEKDPEVYIEQQMARGSSQTSSQFKL